MLFESFGGLTAECVGSRPHIIAWRVDLVDRAYSVPNHRKLHWLPCEHTRKAKKTSVNNKTVAVEAERGGTNE